MSLQHILLGFLSEAPSSGYDLNKRLQSELWHIWSSEQSQVYRSLYKLHDLGQVEFEVVVQDNVPNKKVYRITEDGSQALQDWLQALPDDDEPNEGWLTQLFFGSLMDNDQILQLVDARIAHRQQRLESLQQKQADLSTNENSSRLATMQALSVAHQIARIEAEIDWLQSAHERIAQL